MLTEQGKAVSFSELFFQVPKHVGFFSLSGISYLKKSNGKVWRAHFIYMKLIPNAVTVHNWQYVICIGFYRRGAANSVYLRMLLPY